MRDHVDPLRTDWAEVAAPAVPACRVAVSDLTVTRDRKTLLNIPTLTLEAPGPSVIIGPNGAGKSLLLRLIHGLLPATTGQISLTNPSGGGAVKQAMLFQKPVLLRRSVSGNLGFVLRQQGVPWRDRRARIAALLAQGHLQTRAKQPARSLSGGEQQRLALVRALATGPDLLLLDEPTAPLDPAATREIEDLIRQISASGIKIVMVTHDLGQARRLAAEVVLLHRGQVREQAPTDRFFALPRSTAAQAFLSGDLLR
ncbi:ATP-binding cassette domain-containing protein [Fluviibacterium sp. DFM31]|uniref:ATP-binding cassette domain-containing protein n=1 Tax=Meridianimarinicoccus marinus TaxID=3231483 RepID=A0ABV3L8M9_9RHOB